MQTGWGNPAHAGPLAQLLLWAAAMERLLAAPCGQCHGLRGARPCTCGWAAWGQGTAQGSLNAAAAFMTSVQGGRVHQAQGAVAAA